MKSSLWKNVRVGSFLIHADQYEGVHRVRVTEIDIKLYQESAGPGYPSRWTHPYGLTKDEGTVRVDLNGTSRVLNLRDLIEYRAPWLDGLRRAWNTWKNYENQANQKKDSFLALATEWKG